MSDSMSKAIGQLKDMLSTEEGQQEIENILGGALGQSNSPVPSERTSPNMFNMDSFMRIKNVMDKVQADDPRVRLLTSLRPYISKGRGQHIDNAIKIMTLGRLPNLLNDIRKSD